MRSLFSIGLFFVFCLTAHGEQPAILPHPGTGTDPEIAIEPVIGATHSCDYERNMAVSKKVMDEYIAAQRNLDQLSKMDLSLVLVESTEEGQFMVHLQTSKKVVKKQGKTNTVKNITIYTGVVKGGPDFNEDNLPICAFNVVSINKTDSYTQSEIVTGMEPQRD